MSGVETGSIESIIAKVRLLSDVGWGSSEGSWDGNEKPTESSGERDKEDEKKCWKSRENKRLFMNWESDDELCRRAFPNLRECQTRHDKHLKVNYKINDMMFLNSRNIMIARSLKKLNDKMLKSFKILTEIEHAYRLKLSSTMKIHSEFTSNLLQLNSKDFLKEQWNESFDFIVINDEDE